MSEKVNASNLRMKTKGDLLEHYADKKPTPFVQFDGWDVGVDSTDYVMRPDADGHCFTGGETTELMYGADVRVLIPNGTNGKAAIALLKKIRRWVKKSIRKDGTVRWNTEEERQAEERLYQEMAAKHAKESARRHEEAVDSRIPF